MVRVGLLMFLLTVPGFTQTPPNDIDCSWWTEPRTISWGGAAELFETQVIGSEDSIPGVVWIRPEGAEWSIAVDSDDPGSILLGGPDGCLRVHVPAYRHRPLEARWIKPLILYLEIWFNPHYGAYAVYDVESRSVILSRQLHDGTDIWSQWQEQQEDTVD